MRFDFSWKSHRPFRRRWLQALFAFAAACLGGLASLSGNVAQSPLFTIDTRDQANHPERSQVFRLDTRAAPVELDRNRYARGDLDGDGRTSLADLLLLSRIVAGVQVIDQEPVRVPDAADVDENGVVDQRDVTRLAQLVFAERSPSENRGRMGGFMIGGLSQEQLVPGTPLEIMISGEVSDIVHSVSFGAQTTPVIERPDAHRIITYVPVLPVGAVDVVAFGDGWATPVYRAEVASLPVSSLPAGEFTGNTFEQAESSFVSIRSEILPEMAASGLLTTNEEQSLAVELARIESLVRNAMAEIQAFSPEQKALLDSLLIANGFEELAAEVSASASRAMRALRMSARPTDQKSSLSPNVSLSDFGRFYFYMEMDLLSANLARTKTALAIVGVVVTATGAGAPVGAVLIGASVAVSIGQNLIDGVIPTDLARLRAEFADGEDTLLPGESKEVRFLGDFRTEASKLEAIFAFGLDTVFALLGGSGGKKEIFESVIEEFAHVGIENSIGHALNRLSETWHYDVPVPHSYYTNSLRGLAERGVMQFADPITFSLSLFRASRPAILAADGSSSSLGVFNSNSSTLTAGSSVGEARFVFDAFNIRGADTWYGSLATIGQKFPQRISDARYDPLAGFAFDPPPGSPRVKTKLIPLVFRVEGGTLRIRPSVAAATWAISGTESHSGSGDQDLVVRPGTYTITWGSLNNYDKPGDQTQALGNGGAVTFTGGYTARNGTLRVDTNLSQASWSISGPSSFSGSGNHTRTVPAGSYSITWGSVSGYSRPAHQTRTVNAGSTTIFSGTYTHSAPTGTIQGIVKDGVSGTGISGAAVDIYTTSGTFLGATTTSSQGIYSRTVNAGNVRVDISRTGYVSTSLFASVVSNQTTEADAVLFAPDEPGNGTISGRVVNSLTGGGVGGATVRLRSGVNSQSGSVLQTATATSSGSYSFLTPSGSYTVEASSSGFASGTGNAVAVGGRTIADQDVRLTPNLASGEWRIVLTWGSTPRDLDSHLAGPSSSGGQFHCYYGSKNPSGSGASLDVDDTTGYGPETITISGLRSGTYRYWVHDYSNRSNSSSTAMSNQSGAKVVVWRNSGGSTFKAAEYNVPTGGSGTAWVVFEINGATGQITARNELTHVEGETTVPQFTGSGQVARMAARKSPMRSAPADHTPVLSTQSTDYSHLEALLGAPNSLEFGIHSLPADLSAGSVLSVPVYVRDTLSALSAFDCEIVYDPDTVDLIQVQSPTNSAFAGADFFARAQPEPGVHRIGGWTATPVAAGQFEAAFTLLVRVKAVGPEQRLTLRWREGLTHTLSPLYGRSASLPLQTGSGLGELDRPVWRAAFSAWAEAGGMPDEPTDLDPAMGVQRLAAFAMGWDPRDSSSWHPPVLMPSDGLTLRYQRASVSAGMTWRYERSMDLRDWEPFSPLAEESSELDAARESVSLELPMDNTSEPQFFRIVVEP